MKTNVIRVSLVAACVVLAACTSPEAETAEAPAEIALLATDGQPLPSVVVYKTASCGCCNGWVDHLRAAGFEVDARNVRDLMSVKRDAQVPVHMSSCHTALVDGYVVEGHVPADQIKRLLAERPEIAGIAVPGMPIGSPGMEGRNAKRYQVLTFDAQGQSSVFAEVDPR